MSHLDDLEVMRNKQEISKTTTFIALNAISYGFGGNATISNDCHPIASIIIFRGANP